MKIPCIIYAVLFIASWTTNHVHALPKPDNCTSARHTETLLDIARNGLPKTSEPKHIIIIGAGIAGLTAGKLLKDAGHKVTILEASPRPGGRICTYRDDANRYFVELGAMRMSYAHQFTNAFVQRFNLTTNDIRTYDGNTWFYINGKKIRRSVADKFPGLLGFHTSPEETGKTADELLTQAMKGLLADCYKCGEMDLECLSHYDHYNYQEFLSTVGGLSKGAISMAGAVSEEVSYYFGVSETADYTSDDYKARQYELTGGNDLLPRAFLPSLQDNIIYNARVSQVEHGHGSVIAHYPSSGDEVTISADYLLTTATATSTAFIKFTPELSSDKREAFRNIHYVGATKIVLVFQRPFWKSEGIRGGNTRTDLLLADIFYPSHEFESGVGVIIASYTAADHSDKLLWLSNDALLERALDNVALIHGDYIKALYIEGVVKRWSLDPYSVGGYPCFTPYQLTNYHRAIIRPTNKLFFAGEHATYPHGWVNSAIKSAVEAANCISTKRCYQNKNL